MSNEKFKPLISSEDIVDHMEKRGVKFHNISKEDALLFLKRNNNYFKLTSYRKNFSKYKDGENANKYIDLDFAYLIDLSTIDMHLRHFLLKVTLDVSSH